MTMMFGGDGLLWYSIFVSRILDVFSMFAQWSFEFDREHEPHLLVAQRS